VIVQSRRGDPIELDGATGPVISPLYFTELTIAIDRTYLVSHAAMGLILESV
jgi:hypothetical protein